jgi:hypothetical protein
MNGPFVMNIRPILLIVGYFVTFQYMRIRFVAISLRNVICSLYHYTATPWSAGVEL